MVQIEFDTTLADLYRDHGIPGPFFCTTHCVFAELDLHPEWPRETVYPEDEEPVPFNADEAEMSRLRKIILGVKAVRRAIMMGTMDVIFFKPAATPNNVNRVFEQIIPSQRPRPVFIDLENGNARAQLREASQGQKLIFWRPQGWMMEHDCLVDTKLGYQMNSKQYLITSGIKTPTSEMVSLIKTINGSRLPPSTLSDRPLPFVVKLCLAGCGFGTFLVTTEEKRANMLSAMAQYKKRGGTEVMVSDYIDLKLDLSAHFFIGAPGDVNDHNNPLILGISVQNLTEKGHWTGGSIDYAAQAELKALVMETVRDTTRKLPKSFVGWAGVDIVVNAEGEQWVVDLNPRFTGSMSICLLSNHFFKERGLRHAEFGSFTYPGKPHDIYHRLDDLIESGQVVVGATMAIDEDSNMADLTWGGHDANDLRRVADLVNKKLRSDATPNGTTSNGITNGTSQPMSSE